MSLRHQLPLSFVAIATFLASPQGAAAQEFGGMDAISIDMEVADNVSSQLGERKDCVEALPGDELTVDITAEGIPEEAPMAGYSFELTFDAPPLAISSSQSLLIQSAPGSEPHNTSETLPQFDGSFLVSVKDEAESTSSHESGDGVLERLTLEVGTDAAPATYHLGISMAQHTDTSGAWYSPETVNGGRIAVGLSCGSVTPSESAMPEPPSITPSRAADGEPVSPSVSSVGTEPAPDDGVNTDGDTVQTEDGVYVALLVAVCLVVTAVIAMWAIRRHGR